MAAGSDMFHIIMIAPKRKVMIPAAIRYCFRLRRMLGLGAPLRYFIRVRPVAIAATVINDAKSKNISQSVVEPAVKVRIARKSNRPAVRISFCMIGSIDLGMVLGIGILCHPYSVIGTSGFFLENGCLLVGAVLFLGVDRVVWVGIMSLCW